VGRTDIQSELVLRGVKRPSRKASHDDEDRLNDMEMALHLIQTRNVVVYVGSVAGYKSGLHKIEGKPMLMTASPDLIQPVAGDWSTFRSLLYGMLGEGSLQYLTFLGWMKVFLESLEKEIHVPGQALVLAGPAGAGKSLLQHLLTTLFGGRSARAYIYMSGESRFNEDLMEAEHLVIEDESSSYDMRTRKHFGAMIKNIVANKKRRFEAKFQPSIKATPMQRLSISVNDEPEHLLVLPPFDPSLDDKMILFRVNKTEMPMPTGTPVEKDLFWKQLVSELPAFVHYLLREWEIPEDLKCSRYGVRHYHNPGLLGDMKINSPEDTLLEIIDLRLWTSRMEGERPKPFRGSATELQAKLEGSASGYASGYATVFRQLFHYNGACGSLLAKLERRLPQRFGKRTLHGRSIWKIEPPEDIKDEVYDPEVEHVKEMNEKLTDL
jgi:hypothetical protein